jgi:S-adenosylmethionine decarboxylase proenzyme
MAGRGEEGLAFAAERSDPRYSIDVRIFLTTIMLGMAVSFGVGVGFGPDALAHSPRLTTLQPEEPHHVYLDPPDLDQIAQGEEHQPAGQHLLVDLKNVDADFLNSEERLANAMVDVVKEGGLTLLSYHCHALIPSGVSCVGVLLESHISLQTWPEEGVITVDLFTCGSAPLIPVIPKIVELFGIGENVLSQWSHSLRGFRDGERHILDNQSDLAVLVLSPLEMYKKENVVSVKSPIQQIDIWDVVDLEATPSHQDAIRHNLQPGDPRWLTPELATPDRLLFLDGTLQVTYSLRYNVYYIIIVDVIHISFLFKQAMTQSGPVFREACVHPAMFAHPNPENIVIVGGGEGAITHELLKHKTVKKVTKIELDPMLIELSRQYLPTFSDCSDLEGRADNCFDDELVTILHEDGVEWFVDRYGHNATKEPVDPIDVIIIDVLYPEDSTTRSDKVYQDADFWSSLMKSLSEEGVLSIVVGTCPNIYDPKPSIGFHKQREALFKILEGLPEVAAMFVYEEAHSGYEEPHSFLTVCKSASCRSRWYAESDAIDFQVYDRIVRTKSKERALIHFDGSTQHLYKVPPKAWETVYCRREPTPFECAYRSLDPTKELHEYVIGNEEAGSFTIVTKEVEGEEYNETHVFARVDIPKGSYIVSFDLMIVFALPRICISLISPFRCPNIWRALSSFQTRAFPT